MRLRQPGDSREAEANLEALDEREKGLNKNAWVALLLIGCGDAAIAQTTSTRPPSFGSAGRATAPERHIQIRANVDASYDSNVFGLSDAQIERNGLRGRSKDDFSLTPSLAVDLFLPFGRESVYARGALGYDFYTNNTQLNRERINLALGGDVRVTTSCSAGADATYNRTRSNAGDVFGVTEGTILTRANTTEYRSIGARGQCAGVVGISPSFGYTHSEVRNSAQFFQLNDSNQDTFDASIGYQRPSLGRLSIYGNYSQGTYLNRNVLGLPNVIAGIPSDGVKNYSAGARYERNIGTRLSGAISLGYSWVDPKAVFSQKFRGATYSVNLNVIPTNRLSVDLVASRSAQLSNTVFASYSITEIYSVNGTYKLNDRLDLNFGGSVQKQNFHQTASAIDQSAFLSKDRFTRTYGGFVYNLNRRIRLNGLVSHQRRSADNALFRYNNTTASLGVSLSLGR
ncbi:hypothetical protein SCH01S_43_00190 [Sphingomonas changbaiensis NBRC 104936]|uniref:Outer membrane protein beta-barrel domain-containing protein n=1 Tax=Sphingomonas changbaiensis NBRC 104936 TaxID=1219043 RepID=A0A0E9MRK8_9SPHN|nr:outer membrane beta-barrel protein [Sphingomonas changbaiensis]GAO40118.1 hypothetical protein SCH01S_43_00190 [Sphingomonas changbaiensis NBRC 104936]